jgi:hypothetical protein
MKTRKQSRRDIRRAILAQKSAFLIDGLAPRRETARNL